MKMDKNLLKIHELESGKLYDMVDNPYPNHILYYVDEEGCYCHKDLIVKTQGRRMLQYNEALKLRFYEV
jgi:hypothetical protein